MYNIEIHIVINQLVRLYRLFGYTSDGESSGFRKNGWKFICIIFQVLFLISLISGGLLRDNMIECIFLVSSGIVASVMTVKFIYIFWKIKEVQTFILEIGVHSVADYEEFIKVDKKVKTLMKFSFCFLVQMFASLVGIGICRLPVFSSEHKLPFDVWIPFDWKDSTIKYWIAYAFVVISTTICAISTTLNVILWYLMMNCAIKYQILGNQFRNLFLTKPSLKKKKSLEKTAKEKEHLFLRELIVLIKTHITIKETINRFSSSFENLFIAQITTSGICLCGSVYVLAFTSHGDNLFQYMLNISGLLHNLFDIFMVMYLGNELKLSSDRLSYCLFESNWLEQSKARKTCILRGLLILTEVLKQPQILVIGKVYPLDMEMFTSVMKLAYSAFNILKNFN